eukprot:m51a1_g10587 hypothetical protein (668) ;mRNA; r:179-2562
METAFQLRLRWWQTDHTLSFAFPSPAPSASASDRDRGTLAGAVRPETLTWRYAEPFACLAGACVVVRVDKAEDGRWPALLSAPQISPREIRWVKAIGEYDAGETYELPLREGNVVTVLSENEGGWWHGESCGKLGIFPANFTEPTEAAAEPTPLPDTPTASLATSKPTDNSDDQMKIPELALKPGQTARVRAVFDHSALNETELSFRAGDAITVVSQEPSGWWLGECGGSKGWFPANFVRLWPESPKITVIASPVIEHHKVSSTGEASGGDDVAPVPLSKQRSTSGVLRLFKSSSKKDLFSSDGESPLFRGTKISAKKRDKKKRLEEAEKQIVELKSMEEKKDAEIRQLRAEVEKLRRKSGDPRIVSLEAQLRKAKALVESHTSERCVSMLASCSEYTVDSASGDVSARRVTFAARHKGAPGQALVVTATSDPVLEQRLVRECRLLRGVPQHENVLCPLSSFRDDMPGDWRSLAPHMDAGNTRFLFGVYPGPYETLPAAIAHGASPEQVGEWLRQAMCAVQHLRKHRIVHRDISPDKLLVCPQQRVLRLADFGNAVACSDDTMAYTLEDGASAWGNGRTLPPEVDARGPGSEVSYAAADWFAVGFSFWETLSPLAPNFPTGQYFNEANLPHLLKPFETVQQVLLMLLDRKPDRRLASVLSCLPKSAL